jgi:hypothetical protein
MPYPVQIIASLLLILIASVWTFVMLTRRWTQDRPRAALVDWASENKFGMHFAPQAELPSALASLVSADAHVEALLVRGTTSLLRLTTAGRPITQRLRWHVVIRQFDRAWNPMALRPVTGETSFIDLFSLNGFPSLLPPERFVVFAGDSKDARVIANCPAKGLLPPDIGLLMHGPYVTLDFSSRAFDAIEFNRMLVILEQIGRQLPE